MQGDAFFTGAMPISSQGNPIVCQFVLEASVYIRNLCAHCTAHNAGFGSDIQPVELSCNSQCASFEPIVHCLFAVSVRLVSLDCGPALCSQEYVAIRIRKDHAALSMISGYDCCYIFHFSLCLCVCSSQYVMVGSRSSVVWYEFAMLTAPDFLGRRVV